MAFIVFEGLDASGKSTLIQKVEKYLSENGQSSLLLRDPGSTDLGESLRNIILDTKITPPVPRAETLMYQAARVQMVEKRILPELAKGNWVLCDRFHSSTVAFQSFARGLELQAVEQLNHFVAHDCVPDLYIFLDIPVEESQKRKQSRSEESGVEQDRMEKEAIDFQQKVREGYMYLSQKTPENWLVLDGTQTPEELLNKTVDEIRKRQWLN